MAHGSKQTSSVPSNVIQSGFTSIKWLFLLQIGSKLITFALNTVIARVVTQSSFAIANLQIQLLLNIILPLSREAFRRAALRADIDPSNPSYKAESQKLLNFSWLSIPVGLVLSFLITLGFLWTSTSEELQTLGYKETIWLVGMAAMAELLSEPLYMLANNRLMFGVRASIELLGVGLKSVSAFILIVYLHLGLEAFGLVNLIYALAVSVGYWVYFGFIAPLPEFPSIWRLLPHRVVVKDENGRPHTLGWMESFQHGDVSRFLLTFEWQTLQKMVLQEGEKLLLRGLETLSNQSVFALVHVLGSIVVRFVFAWLEEGLFPVFSKLLVQASSLPTDDTHKQILYQKASIILALLTKLMTYIGLVFASFGFNYAYLLLDLLYTSKYSNTTAPEVLGWYCVYILAMGVNGITEAFAHAAAPPSTLVFFNIAMVFQSILFVASSVFFLKSGFAAGIIMASVVVMASRIFVSFFFIRNFFRDHVSANTFQISHFLPHPLVIIMFAISFSVTHLTQLGLCSPGLKVQILPCAQHVFAGGLCLLITGAVAFLLERRYFRELISFIKTRDV